MNKQQRGELYCHVRSLLNHEQNIDTFLDYIDNNFKKIEDTSSTKKGCGKAWTYDGYIIITCGQDYGKLYLCDEC